MGYTFLFLREDMDTSSWIAIWDQDTAARIRQHHEQLMAGLAREREEQLEALAEEQRALAEQPPPLQKQNVALGEPRNRIQSSVRDVPHKIARLS